MKEEDRPTWLVFIVIIVATSAISFFAGFFAGGIDMATRILK